MDEAKNPASPNSTGNQGNKPRLKKVKRPLNRTAPKMPSSGNMAANNVAASSQQQKKPAAENLQRPQQIKTTAPIKASNYNDENFNLDTYLDGEETQIKNRARGDTPQFLDDESLLNGQNKTSWLNSELPAYLTKKILLGIGAGLFILGILTSKVLFSEQKIVRNGLQGVVINPEVPRGRARCGLAEKTQGCVLYLMNPQRQELNARDFYDLASQLTGRQKFVIETGNMRYSNTKIRPGDIAQLNIPPL